MLINKNIIAKQAKEQKATGQGATSKKSRQRIGYIIRFENYHHIYEKLEIRQVTSLAPCIEEARKHYEAAITGYVKELAQLQFSSLMTFFDGVDAIYKGMKDTTEYEEIQFDELYSNHKLSKLIKKFPLSSIEKGMTTEYRKFHKNLSLEEGLLSAVWDRLKDFMIKKYEHFEFLVSQCYKTQRLAFTSKDLMTSFEHAEMKYIKKYEKDAGHKSESDDE